MFVTVGAHNVSFKEQTQQRISISERFMHPGWNTEKIQNDLALLRLKDTPLIGKYYPSIIILSKQTR